MSILFWHSRRRQRLKEQNVELISFNLEAVVANFWYQTNRRLVACFYVHQGQIAQAAGQPFHQTALLSG